MPLETARLVLDTWQWSDCTAFRKLAQDPRVMRYITGGVPWSDEKIRYFVDRQVSLYTERGFCRWRLVDRPSGEFIGFCGVGLWGEKLLPEIGWWLAPAHWGKGLATEAARCALYDIFERCGLPHLWSVARLENVASRRVMEKIGLRFESSFCRQGVNLVRYEILHADYVRSAPIDV